MSHRVDNWIHGRSCVPGSGEYARGVNPATGRVTHEFARSIEMDVDKAVDSARSSYRSWRYLGSKDRMKILLDIARGIRSHAEELIAVEIEDTGKPYSTAAAEIETAAEYFDFYGGLVNLPVGDVLDVAPNQHVFTTREPFGVIGVITPWNVPLNQAARAVAPAIATGNVVVVKPAESSPQSTALLAKIAQEAGLPDGILNVVLGTGSVVGTHLVNHPLVRKVAFTGSVQTGRTIGHLAADRIIPLTLELGGKSANIIFEDADLKHAANEAVRAFISNAGQICSSGTRLLVQDTIHDAFVQEVARVVASKREGVDFGPMITRGQYEQVQHFFQVASEEGYKPLVGGGISDDSSLEGGFYVQPTVYAGISNEARIAQEEIFGPVLVTIPFKDEEHAVELANASDFGLVAGVFTKDFPKALRVAKDVEAGQVFVNSWSPGGVQAPFGGHKKSGYGREKGMEAMAHYTHVKSVIVVH